MIARGDRADGARSRALRRRGVRVLPGDGVLALFGAPTAHEDDPERAILAGLEIVDSVAAESDAIADRWGIEGLAVRVGIETGLAVLGRVGEGAKLEYGAAGDALNIAARLQAAAEPGAVLAGPRTHRLTAGRFDFGGAIDLALKGKSRSRRGPVASTGPWCSAPVAARSGAPLVGRDSSSAGESKRSSRRSPGSGRILFVTGEAGIGKSRIHRPSSAGALLRRRRGAAMARGTLRVVRRGVALLAVSRPASRVARLACRRSRRSRAARLRTELERVGGEHGSELAESLDLVVATAAAGPGGGTEPPPQMVQERIRAAVAALFAGLASEGPLAVALDDLQWADASSLALVGAPAARWQRMRRCRSSSARAPSAIIRSDRFASAPLRDPKATAPRRSPLEPLGDDRDRDLLARARRRSTPLPVELEGRLLARAEGNPLYLEELVRSMVEVGSLERARERLAVRPQKSRSRSRRRSRS